MDLDLSGPEIANVVGVAGKGRSVLLSQAKDVFTGMIELIEFRPTGKPFPPNEKFNDVGLRMLSFMVSDVDKAYQELEAKGCRFQSLPQRLELPDGAAAKACTFCEPVDGFHIEIFQYLGRGEGVEKED